jgi:DNA (cytosine-5)-methyltransferase 1
MVYFIEVCSGAGGLSSGLIHAGFDCILLNEIDKTFCKTLEKNHHGVKVVHESMEKISLHEYKNVDLICGGIPCQAFSAAGKKKGLEDPRGKLMVEFNRLILECMPKIFMIENVKGLVSHNHGETLKSLIQLFENENKYKIVYQVLNAKDYEVPQKRERVIIIGIRQDIFEEHGEFVFPEKSSKKVLLKDVLYDVPVSMGAKYPESKKKILDLVPEGGCWIHLPEDLQKSYLGASYHSGGGKRGIAKRLAMNDYSLTLTTSPAQKQTERCHPLETRPLTVREYARIQTFPDDYLFEGSMANQYKQIGNAVPVKLAYFIGTSLRNYLLKE